ncbi:MAG: penicillin-binding protein 2 [Candidatus Caenarcaniphilales bacterium]|nr:penicillin-binding protein 2 [Candidatus Caenarcaniphilales bacterium]
MSKFRYRLIQFLVLASFFVVIARLFDLQVLQGSKFYKRVKQLRTNVKSVITRGEIVDRAAKTLAMDIERYTLEYNPCAASKKENKSLLAKKLRAIFDFPESSKKLLYKDSSQTLAFNLTREQMKQIRAINSPSLYMRKVITRFYPEDSFASHILGYVDLYGKARQGIELYYQDFLETNSKAKLELSLDSRLQGFVEEKLEQHIEKTKAAKGSAIVMEVKTGKLLAWASAPAYNPNFYRDYNIEQLKNWSIVDVYQPGSIFKIITVASALDSKTIDSDYKFLDEGYITVDKWRIQNHDYVPNRTESKELDLTGLFQTSSNPFAAHLGLEMGSEVFYNYLKMFGFGNKTGIGLPGESSGLLRSNSTWKDSDLASTAIGQGAIAVTPIQILAAINTIANNGVWITPTILKDPGKHKFIQSKVKVVNSKIAKEIQLRLADSVEKNIKDRWAKAGKVSGIRVAGKTGTAQKIRKDGRYSRYNTIASFIGFYPAEKPEYISLVVIDDPKTDGRWGDTVAGPLFNQITAYVKNLYL